jgi:hypothetical protein
VADRSDADGSIVVDHLVDDTVGADTKRAQSSEPTTEKVPCARVALEQAERIFDGVDQRPAEFEQLAPGAAREDDTGHRSASRPEPIELPAEILKGDDFTAFDLCQSLLQRSQCIGVGEDLSRFFQRLVFVNGNKRGGGGAVASHEHMVPAIGDIAQHLTELAAELAHWDRLRH